MELLNKLILQYLLTNGILNCNEGEELVGKFANEIKRNPKNLKVIITEINEKISKQLFRIDTKICEVTGEKKYVLVNNTNDDISGSLNFTLAETELFEVIITNIMESNLKYISTVLCLNLTSRMRKTISRDKAQEKIDNWITSGYLVKQNGMVYLGPRTIAEFEVFFKNNFSSRMATCKLCTDFVYYGKVCAECNGVIHVHCLSKYFKSSGQCPVCKKTWREAEERIYDDDEDMENNVTEE